MLICLRWLCSVPLRFTSHSQRSSLQNRSKTVQGRIQTRAQFSGTAAPHSAAESPDQSLSMRICDPGPLSQRLFSALAEAGLPVVCIETRQGSCQQRNDAHGIAKARYFRRRSMTRWPKTIPFRAVDLFVEGLDLGKLGFWKVQPLDTGRPRYDPKTMLKIYAVVFDAIKQTIKTGPRLDRGRRHHYVMLAPAMTLRPGLCAEARGGL
jgi:hypothetical protein